MNPKIKISQLPAKGSNLAAADLLEVAEFTGTGYISKSITGQEIIDAAVGNVDWGDIGGTLSDQTDLNTALSGKVPTTRTLTINGTTQDLSADRTFTISTGITVGTTPIASGTVGRVLFEGTGNVLQESANLFWDNTNARLGIGTSSPAQKIDVLGNVNGGNLVNIKNASTGAAAVSGFQCENSISNGSVFLTSSSYTPNGVLTANTLGFYSGGVTPITICSANIITMSTGGVTERLRIGNTGNVLIGTTTDGGFRLDVNGTARVQDNLTISKNQNATTFLLISNTTSGGSSTSQIQLTSDSTSGTFSAFKTSSTYNTYKTLVAKDAGFYNNSTGGDFSFLNDNTTGRFKIAVGASSTAQFIVQSTGNVGINTTTDAGFRLDVNGTARVSGNLTLTGGSLLMNNNNIYIARGTGGASDGMEIRALSSGTDAVKVTTSSVSISSVGGITYQASAQLAVDSTTRGFLPPRMTTTQKNAIATPAAGLMVYDTTLTRPCFYDGTTWITL
jgi:hypothetical protein